VLDILMKLMQVMGISEVQALLRHSGRTSQFGKLLRHYVSRHIERGAVAVLFVTASQTSIKVAVAAII
jgi:hypothetical protein